MFKYFKIGPKLVLLLLAISVIPLLAVSFYIYHYTENELKRRTIDALQAVVDSRAAHINHAIQLRQEQAKEVAGAALLRQLTEAGANNPTIIKGIQDDIDSTFGDLKMSPTSQYKYIDKQTDIDIISVWDVHANVIASTKRKFIGRKMPLEYLQKTYEQGTYFRGLEKDPLTGKDYLVHVEEIRNQKSNLIVGAVVLGITTKTLDAITTTRAGLGKSGETYLVNRKYLMITPSRFIKDAVFNVRVMTKGSQGCFEKKKIPSIYRNYQGIEVLGVQKYLPDQDWCLMAEMESSEAFAPVEDFRFKMNIFIGFLIFTIFIFAYFATRSFTRPILRLHHASQKISAGDYDVEVDVINKDEVGELTRAFNEMVKNLSGFTQELEKKNKTLFNHLGIMAKQKNELREVNAELDSFVYTASHDLRAPLRAIASFASFLEEDYKTKLDKEGQEYIDEIRKGATKMSALIEDLLLLSRISRIKNPYENVAIGKLIESVLERLKFDVKQNNVQMKVQPEFPVVFCDRIKMEEVFLNLINNAIKFSSKNKEAAPVVEVGCTENADEYKFFVKDNGIGIDPKYHQQIFGIFKRLHTDREYEGTGAGLNIVKRVIENHAGRLWIESQLGQGATFCFTIPKGLNGKQQEEQQDSAEFKET